MTFSAPILVCRSRKTPQNDRVVALSLNDFCILDIATADFVAGKVTELFQISIEAVGATDLISVRLLFVVFAHLIDIEVFQKNAVCFGECGCV
jgi:hypothetical protein